MSGPSLKSVPEMLDEFAGIDTRSEALPNRLHISNDVDHRKVARQVPVAIDPRFNADGGLNVFCRAVAMDPLTLNQRLPGSNSGAPTSCNKHLQ
jgi:hypothetical protein